jgi:hypothetical protein
MTTLTREDTEYDVEYVTKADAEREIEHWKSRHQKLVAWLEGLIKDTERTIKDDL